MHNHKTEIWPSSSTQFGAKFQAECEQCLQRKSNINMEDVKARCQSMLIELVHQVDMRVHKSEGHIWWTTSFSSRQSGV